MVRYQLARDEMAQGCSQLEALYREKLKDQKKLLAVLNQFIVARRLAIDAEVKLVGGSWDGGSGARVAYPSARLHALVNYRLALDDLRSSLHLQDLPPVPRVATVKPKAKE
ncbi:MAG TPA: hypothetical protein VG796_04320 [Verrucomicrobiales bacterium]|nr:hypothetical protein [Verrucomicrobiales bacterium]